MSAQLTDEGSKDLTVAISRKAGRGGFRLRDPSPDPTPWGHPLPQGERGRSAYFASSYVADTSTRTFNSPAETGLLSALSILAMAYIGIGG